MPILQKERHFANSSVSAHQGKKTFRHIREDFAGESGVEASDHANPKWKMNQDLTGDTGITNPILHLTPISIVFNIQKSHVYQWKRLEKTFPRETKLSKITGVRPFMGSTLLFSSRITKFKVKVSCKFFLKNNFVI